MTIKKAVIFDDLIFYCKQLFCTMTMKLVLIDYGRTLVISNKSVLRQFCNKLFLLIYLFYLRAVIYF